MRNSVMERLLGPSAKALIASSVIWGNDFAMGFYNKGILIILCYFGVGDVQSCEAVQIGCQVLDPCVGEAGATGKVDGVKHRA